MKLTKFGFSGRFIGVVATLLAMESVLAPAQAQAGATPVRGGTAVVAIGGEPTTLNPNITSGAPELIVGCMIHDGLVRYAENFKVVPNLATSWEISPDGLAYTFKLASTVWHDGKPFTSNDVRYTLKEVSSKYGPNFMAAGRAIETIETPDPQTVIFRLAKPFGPLLFSLACEQNAAILPAHLYEGTNVLQNPTNLRPVGTGTFKYEDWKRGSHVSLARNPTYRREGKPYLDQMIVKVVSDASGRVLALRAGEVDYIDQFYFPLSAYTIFAKNPQFQLREQPFPLDDIIMLNVERAPLNNAKVRQALMTAIDRDYILRHVFFGLGAVSRSAIDTRIDWAYDPSVDYEKMYPFDPAKAAKMLDEAGVKPGPNGVRFTINLVFDTGRAEYIQWAQALQRYWQAIGVRTVIEGSDRAVALKRVFADYDFGATLQTYTTSGDPALGVSRIYTTESINSRQVFNNATRYSNAQLDAAFDAGRNASTREERAKYYAEAQKIIARELPTLTTHELSQIDAATARLRNIEGARHVWWDGIWLQR
jgi:peptide/nickel transport system substrate-binding protein